MRVRRELIAVIAALALNACASLDAQWRWHGVNVQDQADIRAVLRKIMNSPIVALQPRDPQVPNQLYFYTAPKRHEVSGRSPKQFLFTDCDMIDLTNR